LIVEEVATVMGFFFFLFWSSEIFTPHAGHWESKSQRDEKMVSGPQPVAWGKKSHPNLILQVFMEHQCGVKC
jgi:hypothetical protein